MHEEQSLLLHITIESLVGIFGPPELECIMVPSLLDATSVGFVLACLLRIESCNSDIVKHRDLLLFTEYFVYK